MPDTAPDNPAIEGERTVLIGTAIVGGVVAVYLLWQLITGFSGVISFFEYIADRPDEVFARTVEHVWLTVASIGTATLISVPLAIAIHNNGPAKQTALAIASILLTVPSFAFFAGLIPLVGIGFYAAYIPLTIYAILPILRNTLTGFDQVDPAVIESAKGMGLGSWDRIRKILLPLAWPVTLTGIRVATILTISIAAIATLIAAGGLGDFIQNGIVRNGFPGSVESIWTGTVFTVLLALIFERLFVLITRLTTSKGLQ